MITAKVILIGNVGKIGSSYTPQGTYICKFTVAVNRGRDDAVKTDWYSCTAWGKQGEMANKLIMVGTELAVEGVQAINIWNDKEGKEHTTVEISVTDFRITARGKKKEDVVQKAEEDDLPY